MLLGPSVDMSVSMSYNLNDLGAGMADKKILIVDYDKKSLESMVAIFSGQDFQIVEASDGQTAYKVYQEESPDLIILEAMLPKLHGFDLTQKIHKESGGSVPVVIVTGLYKGPQYRNEALRSFGAADYFEKPFDKDKLFNSVLNLLQSEIDIKEELPDTKAVIDMVLQMSPKPKSATKKK